MDGSFVIPWVINFVIPFYVSISFHQRCCIFDITQVQLRRICNASQF